MELRAARAVTASPECIFEYLEELERHLELISDRALPESVTPTGSRLRLRGPLGIGRTVSTTLTHSQAPHSIVGRARVGGRTHGTVRWSIEPSGQGSWVQVVAGAETIGLVDRVLLTIGGRRWLERSLELALERLEDRMRAGIAQPASAEER